jgi:hypothetical protein
MPLRRENLVRLDGSIAVGPSLRHFAPDCVGVSIAGVAVAGVVHHVRWYIVPDDF